MDIVAAILLFLAAFVGIFPLTHVSKHHAPPARLAWAHIALAALGILSLLIYAFTTEAPHKHWDTLGILSVAIVLGIILLVRGGNYHRPGLALAYTAAGMFGMLWLLTFVIPNT